MCACLRIFSIIDRISSGMMVVMLYVVVRMLLSGIIDVRRGKFESVFIEGLINVNNWMIDDILIYNLWFNICILI